MAAELDAVVLRAIARDPKDRFQDVDQILKALGVHLPSDFSGGTVVVTFLQKHYDVVRERELVEKDLARGRGFLQTTQREAADRERAEPAARRRSGSHVRLLVGACAGLGLLVATVFLARRSPPPAPTGDVTTSRPTAAVPPPSAPEPRVAIPAPPENALPVPAQAAPKTSAPRRVRAPAPERAPEMNRAAADPSASANLLADGQRRFDTGDVEGALRSARAAIRAGGGAPAHLLAGRALGKLNLLQDAEHELAIAVRLDPTNAFAAQRLRENPGATPHQRRRPSDGFVEAAGG